jgi:hypothetical protein
MLESSIAILLAEDSIDKVAQMLGRFRENCILRWL